jgi:glyoxylase-like metal-dependent hydrolase (beta-lactamase superfamily II)
VEVDEIAPGIWRWTAAHPEWRPDVEWAREVASFAFAVADTLVLVDPLVPEDAWPRLDELAAERASVAALITVPYHVRSSEDLVERYGAKASVWGHQAVARRLRDRSILRPIEPGAALPAGAQAFAIGSPRRQEMPLWFPSHRALAFGDAVVGVDGTLRVWEVADTDRRRAWYRERFVPSLEPLLALEIENVLVTHGPPVVGGGREALAEALAGDPWHYR